MLIFNRLELDVLQKQELDTAVDLAIKFGIPSIVVHQDLYTDLVMQRLYRKGRFKLIVPIDWPRGELRDRVKFRGLSCKCLRADGFEIYLSGGITEAATRAEILTLEHLVDRINPVAEIRYVLGTQSRPESMVLGICHGMIGWGTAGCRHLHPPQFIRTDIQLKTQVSKGNCEVHTTIAGKISEVIDYPLKACGNFNTAKDIVACPWASRVAVGITQLLTIVEDLKRAPGSQCVDSTAP